MGSFVTLLVIAIVLVVGGFVLVGRAGKKNQRHQETVENDPNALRYRPPAGQDPAVVVAAVRKAGFTTTLDETTGGTPTVLISAHDDSAPDREQVRRIIADTDQVNFEGDAADVAPSPRFVDE
jgi:hypothetical protein